MIELLVKGIRGIGSEEDSTTLTYGKVTKVVGPNCSGKTSRAVALAALLARNTDPLSYGVQMAKRYINDETDADEAVATLSEYDNSNLVWKITWKVGRGNFEIHGDPPGQLPPMVASPVLVTAEMLKKEFIDAMFVGSIDKVELVDRLAQIFSEVNDTSTADAMASQILRSKDGWAEAHSIAKERALGFKRSWDTVVAKDGQKVFYGETVGRNWRPTKWAPELEAGTIESVDRKIYDAKTQLEHAQDKVRELKNQQELYLLHKEKIAHVEKLQATLAKTVTDIEEVSGLGIAGPTEEEQEEVVNADKAMATAQHEYSKCLGDIKEKKQEEKDWQKAYDDVHAELKESESIYHQLDKLNKAIKEKEKNSAVCETCGQELKTDDSRKRYRAELKSLRKELDEMDVPCTPESYKERAAEMESLNKAVMLAQQEVWALLEVEDIKKLALQKATQRLAEARGKITFYARQLTDRKDHITKLNESKAHLSANIEALMKEVIEVSGYPEDYEVEAANRQVDICMAEVRNLEHQKEMIQWVHEAKAAHHMIRAWNRIKDFVGPDGIRREKIEEGTKTLGDWLKYLQKGLNLRNLAEFRGGKLLVGGKPAKTASGSEQWVASAILRVAMTIMNEGRIVAIDGADILDAGIRQQAYGILDTVAEYADIAILVTETEVN